MKRFAQAGLSLLLGTMVLLGPTICQAGGKGGHRGGGGHRSGGGGTRGAGGGFGGHNAIGSRTFGQQSFHRNPMTARPSLPTTQLKPSRQLSNQLNGQNLSSNSLTNHSNANRTRIPNLNKQLNPGNLNTSINRLKGNVPGNDPGFKSRSTTVSFPANRLGDVAKHSQSDHVRDNVARHCHGAPRGHVVHHRCGNWWLRFACGVYHCHGRPWVCYDGYWSCWHPCSYNYVRCYGYDYRYFVGMECVTIPDVNSLGVEFIQPGSPAELAGLQAGDVIVSVNGKPVSSEDVITNELPTERLNMEVIRDGAETPTMIALVPQRVAVGSL